jgi:DNA-directed RNA polymerase specialized sigma24 family protein
MRLLWIGLWPGLCAIRRRWSGWFVPRTELDSELANCFTEAIERVDPARGHRLAATLVGNTERLLRQASEREREDARILRSDPSFLAAPETAPSRLGILEGVTEVEKVRRLRAWLTEVAGLDADLVLRAALFDHARRDLGDEIGIDSVVVRKRLERALRRAREQLDEKSDRALSQRGSEKRVPRLTPNSRLVRAHKKESS